MAARKLLAARRVPCDGARMRFGTWIGGAALWLCLAGPAGAADLELGKYVWTTAAGCNRCHGWAGQGTPELPAFPTGANLRESSLDRGTLREVVRCGIPGTEMPRFTRETYTGALCYGAVAADMAGTRLPELEVPLSEAQIEALLDYLLAKVIGQGPVTAATCADYYGPALRICRF